MPRPDDPIASLPLVPATFAEGGDSLRRIATKMAGAHARCVVIRGRDGSLGFVSEHDIVHAIAAGGDPDAAWAVDVMSHGVVAEPPDRPITEVAELMRTAQVRHVVVLDGHEVRGVASIHEVVGVLLDALGAVRG